MNELRQRRINYVIYTDRKVKLNLHVNSLSLKTDFDTFLLYNNIITFTVLEKYGYITLIIYHII